MSIPSPIWMLRSQTLIDSLKRAGVGETFIERREVADEHVVEVALGWGDYAVCRLGKDGWTVVVESYGRDHGLNAEHDLVDNSTPYQAATRVAELWSEAS